MNDELFIEIDKFETWAQSTYNLPLDDIGGEWECSYLDWNNIYLSFKNFLQHTNPELWTKNDKRRLLYIIARDNETEFLANILSESELMVLTEESISDGHRDDKWQLATQLYKLSDKQLALKLLEKLVNDEDEYVSRRSLIELAKLSPDKTEFYAKLFWTRNKYGELDEYQKISVLHSLNAINSSQLDKYIELAKVDGRKYLVKNAKEIEHKNRYL